MSTSVVYIIQCALPNLWNQNSIQGDSVNMVGMRRTELAVGVLVAVLLLLLATGRLQSVSTYDGSAAATQEHQRFNSIEIAADIQYVQDPHGQHLHLGMKEEVELVLLRTHGPIRSALGGAMVNRP